MSVIGMNNSAPSFVRNMIESDFTFYMTGSRFWGNYYSKSDWDFFTHENQMVYSWLVQNGFEVVSKSTYTDLNCSTVMQKGKIQVQLVKDAKVKNDIQKILFDNFPNGFPDKEFAKRMWNLAYKSYMLGL